MPAGRRPGARASERASCTPGRVGKRGRAAAGPRPSGDGQDWREPPELEPGSDPCSPAGLSSLPAGRRAPPGGRSPSRDQGAGGTGSPGRGEPRSSPTPSRREGPAVAGSWSLLNPPRVPRGGCVPVLTLPPPRRPKVTTLTVLMSAFCLLN